MRLGTVKLEVTYAHFSLLYIICTFSYNTYLTAFSKLLIRLPCLDSSSDGILVLIPVTYSLGDTKVRLVAAYTIIITVTTYTSV
jgi:hypothetical protein